MNAPYWYTVSSIGTTILRQLAITQTQDNNNSQLQTSQQQQATGWSYEMPHNRLTVALHLAPLAGTISGQSRLAVLDLAACAE